MWQCYTFGLTFFGQRKSLVCGRVDVGSGVVGAWESRKMVRLLYYDGTGRRTNRLGDAPLQLAPLGS